MPLDDNEFQVVSGQPPFLPALVLNTVFMKPGGQDPPPLPPVGPAGAGPVKEYGRGSASPPCWDTVLFDVTRCLAAFTWGVAPPLGVAAPEPGVAPPLGVAAPEPGVAPPLGVAEPDSGAERGLQGPAMLPAASNESI